MKIIHTSDWHLGHTLYSFDRQEEQQCFLQQLAQIVANEQPDALVVSGDIYHTATPSAATQRLYTECMLRIHEACPTMTIVVTAGNHDSASKLEIDSSLWHHFGVKVIGGIARNADGNVDWSKHIVSLPAGTIAAVPHMFPQNFPTLCPDTPREERQPAFFKALSAEAHKLTDPQLPIVLMAHLSVEGSDRNGHSDPVGGIEYTPLPALGKGYTYMALGHIHCPQNVRGSENRARYCGSPIAISFDETYPHSVSVVEMGHADETPHIRTIEIANPLPLLTLPARPMPWEEALQCLESFPDDERAYIRLQVAADGYLPATCNEQALTATRHKACRYCYTQLVRTRTTELLPTSQLTIEEVQSKSPLEIAQLYFKERTQQDMDEELTEMMRTAIKRIDNDL